MCIVWNPNCRDLYGDWNYIYHHPFSCILFPFLAVFNSIPSPSFPTKLFSSPLHSCLSVDRTSLCWSLAVSMRATFAAECEDRYLVHGTCRVLSSKLHTTAAVDPWDRDERMDTQLLHRPCTTAGSVVTKEDARQCCIPCSNSAIFPRPAGIHAFVCLPLGTLFCSYKVIACNVH